MAGVEPASLSDRDGRDILGILADKRGHSRAAVFAELATCAMIRNGNWKLIFDSLVDVSQLIEKDGFSLDEYFPLFFEHWTYKGRLLGFPIEPSSPVTVYNHDAFIEAGLLTPHQMWQNRTWSWDTAVDAGQRLTKDLDGDGAIDRWGYNPTYRWLDWAVGSIIYDGGGEIITSDLKKCKMNDPDTVATLKWVHDVYNVYKAGNVHQTVSSEKTAFGTGVPLHALRNEQSFQKRYGITVIPPKTADSDPVNVIIGPASSLLKGGNVDVAWDYVKFLGSMEASKLLVDMCGRLPALRAGAEYWMQFYQGDNPEAEIEAIGYAKSLPYNVKWWSDIRPILVEGFEKIFTGQAAVETVTADMTQRIDNILKEL